MSAFAMILCQRSSRTQRGGRARWICSGAELVRRGHGITAAAPRRSYRQRHPMQLQVTNHCDCLPISQQHFRRLASTDGAAAVSSSTTTVEDKCSYHYHQQSNPSIKHDAPMLAHVPRATENISELTQRLLATSIDRPNKSFHRVLDEARTDASTLKTMRLKPEEAKDMFILPPDLLMDVKAAINFFSRRENSHGIRIGAQSPGESNDSQEQLPTASPTSISHEQKVPGPILCARLLELLGVPNHYHSLQSSSLTPPLLVVHSSQVDMLLECCLQTNLALSRSCETGRYSLIGIDINLQLHPNSDYETMATESASKSAAQLAEEIWRCVWNMRIKYTSGRRGAPSHILKHTANVTMRQHHAPSSTVRIGRIGSLETGAESPILSYLTANRHGGSDKIVSEEVDRDYLNYSPTWVPMASELGDGDDASPIPWSPKDKLRYDQSLIVFNTVLASYAKLSSSASGTRNEVRKDMLQSAERLLLEVASNNRETPSPSNILQCLQPDAISFNTTMSAWAAFSGRNPAGGDGAHSRNAGASAERAESILKMMQELWDEERSNFSTYQSMQKAWEAEYGRGGSEELPLHPSQEGQPPSGRYIAPNISTYNTVLSAWSSSPDSLAAVRALKVYQTILNRGNVACLARESLLVPQQPTVAVKTKKARRDSTRARDALPDSRTLVALLQSFPNLSSSVGFTTAIDTVESIYQSMKQYDKQMQWSMNKGILDQLSHLGDDSKRGKRARWDPILNVYSFNTLIKILSNLGNSWEENLQCCERIDALIGELSTGLKRNCLPNAVTAWANCAKYAEGDNERARMCAEKAGAYVDSLLTDYNCIEGKNRKYLIQAVNEAIVLYGRARMPADADALFNRAKKSQLHNLGTLSDAIVALCEGSDDIAHSEMALRYLLEYEQEKMKIGLHSSFTPDHKYTKMYNAVIKGLLDSSSKKRGIEQAQTMLSHMISNHESNPSRHIARPNTTSFALVISALAQRGNNTHLLEDLLSKMEELHERHGTNVAPNLVIYNLLLKSYARNDCDENDALPSALKLLGRMEKRNISPDDLSNSYMLMMLSRKKKDDGFDKETNSQLDLDLDNLDDLNLSGLNLGDSSPTSKSFNSIMNIHTTTGTLDGAEKGAALLRKLEEMYESKEIGFRPDVYLYNKLMNAWQLCEKNKDFNDPVSPAEKAEEVLNFLCEEHERGGLSPNCVSFSICIHAWCKSSRPDAAERAEQILRRKELFANKHGEVKLQTADYNSVIAKWKDDNEKGTNRATLLFEEMIQRYGSSSEECTKPNSATLNALLDVFAKQNVKDRLLAEKAGKYLNLFNKLHKEGKCEIQPDVISYRSVIDAWIKRWDKDSPKQVDNLVKEMIAKYRNEGREDLRPDTNAFNLVLKACSHAPASYADGGETADGKEHPLSIANRTFGVLRGGNEFGASATHASYSFMFHIYRQHMNFRDKRYLTLMQKLWKECCNEGLVSGFSLSSFRAAVLEPHFWAAIGGKDRYARSKTDAESIKVDDLPMAWRRNVEAKPT